MSAQLDILALEPFYGGARRLMLEAVIRCSRHRWTLLKLPPRRIERRLTAAAHWFAEQLTRHWVGHVDLLFTSEAMNVADLFRLIPHLSKKPSVVYFHDNQLPEPGRDAEATMHLVNLNTATAANEIWFNSLYHMGTFLHRAGELVERHPEMSAHNPVKQMIAKSHLMLPPTDFGPIHEAVAGSTVKRDSRTMFVDTRGADCSLLNKTLEILQRRNEPFHLITVGPIEELAADLPRTTLAENDALGQIQAMRRAALFISIKQDAAFDHHAILALAAGCWPIVPNNGVYEELIPNRLHGTCLYPADPDELAGRLQDFWSFDAPQGASEELQAACRRYDSIPTCKAIDERLQDLAAHSVKPI